MGSLVIVESPTKARTIRDFLPRGYHVAASMGHIRDLPDKAADIPAKLKGEEWARLGVNVENDFEPLYVVPADKKKVVKELKDLLKNADELILATDEDREGESISWHLTQVLAPKVKVRRMVFHEITREAIREALETTRDVDDKLVRAQETRRILDRLYGYTLSPPALEKDRLRALRRTGAVGGGQTPGSPGAGAARIPSRGLLGPQGPAGAQESGVRCRPGRPQGRPDRHRQGLRRKDRQTHRRQQGGPAGRAGRRGPAGPAVQKALAGRLQRGKAGYSPARRTLHYLDASAGSQPQASALRPGHHAGGPEPVRERLHHLHAHRLGASLGPGHHRLARMRGAALRQELPAGQAEALLRQERA